MSGVAVRVIPVGIAVLVVGVGIGVMSGGVAEYGDYAVLAALAVLAVGVAVAAPKLLIALALPSTLLMARVGGILSISDFVLALATVLSFTVIKGRDLLPMRALMWAGVAYIAASLPAVILNPYSANVVEWVHEVVLILGSMVVGFTIGRSGQAALSAGIYTIACVGIAIAATVAGVYQLATEGSFGPVYLPELHKNTIGGALAVAIVLLYARPAWFRWPRLLSWVAIGACVVGIAASGSRQGMVGAVVGLLVVALRRNPETGRIRVVPWLAAIPIAIAVFTLVDDQLAEDNQFNSAYQRLDWYAQTVEIWRESPVFGVGLRWWYTGQYAAFQPPNAELEVLSSVGVVGLIGFLVMFLVAAIALWRLDPAYGTVGVAVVATRFTQGQFDLYWVAGQASLLWIVAGICYGAVALRDGGPLRPDRFAATPTSEPARVLTARRYL